MEYDPAIVTRHFFHHLHFWGSHPPSAIAQFFISSFTFWASHPPDDPLPASILGHPCEVSRKKTCEKI
uniref:Uncharacterized protein n=1 Tax=Cucumis sativus TaxID=3659 RepID=A0A0A0L9E6_CUCSA